MTIHLHRVADALQLDMEPPNWSLQVVAEELGTREMVEMPVELQGWTDGVTGGVTGFLPGGDHRKWWSRPEWKRRFGG